MGEVVGEESESEESNDSRPRPKLARFALAGVVQEDEEEGVGLLRLLL